MRQRTIAGLLVVAAAAGAGTDDPTALVRRLGSGDLEVREASQKALEDAGPAALPALEAARADADSEIRARVVALLSSGRFGLTPELVDAAYLGRLGGAPEPVEAALMRLFKGNAGFKESPTEETIRALTGEVVGIGRLAVPGLSAYRRMVDAGREARFGPPPRGWDAVPIALERILAKDAALRNALLRKGAEAGFSDPVSCAALSVADGPDDARVAVGYWRSLEGRLGRGDLSWIRQTRFPEAIPLLIEALASDAMGDSAAGILAELTGRVEGIEVIELPKEPVNPRSSRLPTRTIRRSAETARDPAPVVASWKAWYERVRPTLRWDPETLSTTAPLARQGRFVWEEHPGGGGVEEIPPALRIGAVGRAHSAWVHDVAFSPKGDLFASAGEDGSVRVWDAATGKLVHEEKGSHPMQAVAFSPDGTLVASGGVDYAAFKTGEVRLWEARTGKAIRAVEGLRGGPTSVAFSPDGKTLAAGSREGWVRLVELSSGKALWERDMEEGNGANRERFVNRLAFSPDGASVAAISAQGTLRVLAGKDGATRWTRAVGGAHDATKSYGASIAYSSDGKTLAACHLHAKAVQILDAGSGEPMLGIPFPRAAELAFSPDGKALAVGSGAQGGTVPVRLVEAATGQTIRELPAHQSAVTGLAFSPDGKRLASGGLDNQVRLWDAASGSAVLEEGGHKGAVHSLAFSPDGRIWSGGADATLRSWDLPSGKETAYLTAPGFLFNLALSADGKRLAISSNPGGTLLWDLGTGKRTFTSDKIVFGYVALSPDGKRLYAAGVNGLEIADADSAKVLRKVDLMTEGMIMAGPGGAGLQMVEGASGIACSPDGRLLAIVRTDGKLTIYSASGDFLHERQAAKAGSWCSSAAFSPDGRILATGGHDHRLRLWEVSTLKEIRSLPSGATHDFECVSSIAFSPDGRYVVSASGPTLMSGHRSDDGILRVWEVATGTMAYEHRLKESGIQSLAFSPDGARPDGAWLAAGLSDGRILAWKAASILKAEAPAKADAGKRSLEILWERLASDDPAEALAAVEALASEGEEAVRFLSGRLDLPAPTAADEKEIRKLVEVLDDDEFAPREKAALRLLRSGAGSLPTLHRSLEGDLSEEARNRVQRIVRQIESEEALALAEDPDTARLCRAAWALERIGTPKAAELLASLAMGPPASPPARDAREALSRLGGRDRGKQKRQ